MDNQLSLGRGHKVYKLVPIVYNQFSNLAINKGQLRHNGLIPIL